MELGKNGQTLTNGADRITISSNVYVPNGRLITEADLNSKEGDAGIFNNVKAASITNYTLANVVAGSVFGGITLVANDRILFAGQSVASQNGIYIAKAGVAPVRATDADNTDEYVKYKMVGVSHGTLAGYTYYQSSDSKPVIDTGAIEFGVVSFGIADNAVTNDKLADDSVGSDEIIDGSIGSAHLGDDVNTEIDGKVNRVDLASITAGNGASTVGVQDAGENFTSDNAEGVFLEIDGRLDTIVGVVGNGSFTEENYVADGDTMSEATDKLDIQAKVNADLTSDNSSAIGSRLYTNDNYMVDGETITASLDRVDVQLAANVANDALKVEKTKLAGVTSAADEGAKIVGVYDADGRYTATTVEGALSEVKALADSTALGVGAFWAAADLHAIESDGNITLSGEQTLDGVLTSTSRVLIAHNTDAKENGIYDTAAGAWTRAADADASSDFTTNKTISIDGGVTHAGAIEAYDGASSPTLGSDNITFAHKSSSGLGDGAVTTAKVANGAITNVKLGDDSVDGAKLADNSVDTNHLVDSSVTNDKIAGPIAANKVQGLNAALYTKIDTKLHFFTYGDVGTVSVDSVLPNGAYINNVKVFTETAFNGTGVTLTIGKAGAAAEIMAAPDNDLTEIGTDWSGDIHSYSDTQITATLAGTGMSAGAALIIVEYFKN